MRCLFLIPLLQELPGICFVIDVAVQDRLKKIMDEQTIYALRDQSRFLLQRKMQEQNRTRVESGSRSLFILLRPPGRSFPQRNAPGMVRAKDYQGLICRDGGAQRFEQLL